jgi:uncharacterized protein (DUF697 family)
MTEKPAAAPDPTPAKKGSQKGPGFWKSLRQSVLAPKVSDAELERCLARVRKELPIPVFWLLGKTQSGKTSVIRALTGTSRAEIGNGFRPCTRTAQLYPFPNEEECFLRFLDTRGLGEVSYDPAEDMHVCENQAHLLLVVMRAADHAQQCVLEPLKKVKKAHPNWPLLVVQTSLHEAYPEPTTPHVLPYPFGDSPLPATVPSQLARTLAAQRKWFAGYEAHFVPVDFTLPEDRFEPENYGLDALWAAVEDALPLGLRAMLRQEKQVRKSLRDVYFKAAHPHVISYSIAAGSAAIVPIPIVDVPLILAIQAKMFHTIASIYGQKMSKKRMAEIGSTLGLGFLARIGGGELLKFIPGVGSAAAALFAGASTYALGRTLCAYFSYALDGDVPDQKALRKLYAEEYEEGRKRLASYLKGIKPSQEAAS